MARTPLGDVLGRVCTLLAAQQAGGVPDCALLGAFVEQRDEGAFAALVHRHGAMVFNVCRRALRDLNDAEDAFQATFLVLARKAGSVRRREALAGWLHAVASRVARKLQADRCRRERRTEPLVEVPAPDAGDVSWREVWSVLDEELARLPDAYRAPLVLCYLEGKTQDEAARELGWTTGALRGRLERGRQRLRGRLVRRGLGLSALCGAAVAAPTSATALAALEVAAVKAVLAPTAAHSAQVALADGVSKAMFLGNLRATVVMLTLTLALVGGAVLTYHSASRAMPASGPARPAARAAASPAARAAAKPATPDDRTIRALIAQLGDDSFKRREQASKRLVAIGAPALELLRRAARDGRDLEVRRRAGQAVRAIERALFHEVRRFTGHPADEWLGRVALTPAGRRAVSVGPDGLRCWDLATGKQLLTFGPRKTYCWALAISRDGRRVLAGADRVVCLFDLKTGKEVRRFVGHTGSVWGAALSVDGKWALTGAWDRSLRVWDVETGKQVRAFVGVRENVRCLALSPEGKFVVAGHFAVANGPGTVRIWEVKSGKEVRAFVGHALEVSSVAFSPDGKQVLSSGFDRTIRLWDVATGKELKRFTGHTQRVEYAAFTPDGRQVVSCGNEHNPTIRIWDVASGKQLLESEPVGGGFLCVAVLPDGRHCVTTGKDGVVRLWRWKR
jgi:RNA polymerase sigma factor (sigma-70 family)